MPLPVYRKLTGKTRAYAKAETLAKAKLSIPKYGETIAFTLEVNFAINIWINFNEFRSILGMHQDKRLSVYALHPHI